ncbi:acetoacetate--CoA ligase [Leisingera sp. ANG59]|uniref:acetoacetate--CoA ligase n=1 Tax=Leisingera sp. ANG59 TaxID=2675221 RepID=UPI0015732842|nr:acetoacetate--CoA ligase [Leisingera sp. ANG59]NSY40382.1 acetoacetate--CoA ligase [Leisingera sp. ANG59]
MNTCLWTPSAERVSASLLNRFMREYGPFEGYDALWEWSVTDRAAFWSTVWDFCGVTGLKGNSALSPGEHMIDDRFFPEARLNYAENLLRADLPGPVLIGIGEDGTRSEMSWAELRAEVSRLQQALRAAGVGKGDRVAGVMPNIPETILAMLAATSLGAVWSSCSPDFGTQTLIDRLGQIRPKVIFTVPAYHYNGKTHRCMDKLRDLAGKLDDCSHLVCVPYAGESGEGPGVVTLAEFCAPHAAGEPVFEPMGFDDPLFILFSSGTTGLPKCIIHRTGGALLQHLKEHQLQGDIRPGDRLFYYTTCGWMMWNWQVSALASGATLVLFDGSPFYPSPSRLADLCVAERVTHFGISAKYIESCMAAGFQPKDSHDLTALRVLFSTGSPLSESGFAYVYERWKSDLCLSSIAGGTDILGCFVGGSPISPVYAGQSQKRQLGMAVDVVDEAGTPLRGSPGELISRLSHPSMPLGFLNDTDRARYRNSYFETYPGLWHQGDLVELMPEGGMEFFGRSDATLNPGGVRIGTAELYRQVERVAEVADCVAVGQRWNNDERIILFVQLQRGVALTEALVKRIRDEIRANTSPRHVPAKVIQVAAIPYTRTGKIAELAIKNLINGRDVTNGSALRNPESLQYFSNLPEISHGN